MLLALETPRLPAVCFSSYWGGLSSSKYEPPTTFLPCSHPQLLPFCLLFP
ncbi:hypothetical protein ACRRTK_013865 [Alexandromys fortis]